MKFILGKKIGMSRRFTEQGESIPVTLIEAGPCKVLQKKTKDTDGYRSVQLGLEQIVKKNKERKSAKDANFKYVREFLLTGESDHPGSDTVNISLFEKGDELRISGISKGKGFQGGVKRWGFAGASASHGIKHSKRKIGSIGCAHPQKVRKGRKMPGRMGSDRVTVKGLKIVEIDTEKNIIAVKGAVPGRRGALLEIRLGL